MSMSRSARGFSRSMNAKQRLVHHIHALITGTGTATVTLGSTELTITDNGTGDWTLTPVIAGSRLLNVQVTPVATAGDVICCVQATSSASAIRIVAFDATDGTTAKDAVFYLHIVLSDSADEI